MHRREFLLRSASGFGAAFLASNGIFKSLAETTLPKKFSAFAAA